MINPEVPILFPDEVGITKSRILDLQKQIGTKLKC